MKNTKKRGFTIVELVIVIAVIAILAAVLIPTFSNVIAKANESRALQEARNKYTEAYALDIADGVLDGNEKTTPIADTNYTVTNGVASYTYTVNGYTASFNGTDWTVTKAGNTDES